MEKGTKQEGSIKPDNTLAFIQTKRRIILTEILVVFVVIFAVLFLDVVPDVFVNYLLFLAVTLFGIRYGLLYGGISIIAAVLIYLYHQQKSGYDLILMIYQAEQMLPLIFLMMIGVITGLFRSSLNERYEDLLYQKIEVDDERKEMKETIDVFRNANEQLKKKVLESENNLATIYTMTQMLKKGQSEKILNEAAEIIRSHYGAEAFGLYHVDQSKKVLRMKVNMAVGNEKMPNSIFFESAPRMFERVLEDKGIFFRKADDDESNTPLIAAPITIDHEVKFVLIVQKVDFYRMTSEGLEVLKWILQFIADPLANTMKQEEDLKGSAVVEGTSFYKMEFFEEYVSIEKEREELTKQPYTIFQSKIPGTSPELLQFLSKYLVKTLREIDVIGLDLESATVHFLLPGTDPGYAASIKKRIITSITSKVKSNVS